ncbi:NADH dehydrogenase subunit C [Devosia sp. YR412]|uniref:NADH-quinone oxidoreductase subunit C n=1 Tax=Devosia sp. YR412 TaxID=1881030 RepID=UPI0008D3E22B|nr:NADH-quinone oxidoreductase subunit C [Devosia sp. YR412]SEQ50353.1 NADH dehydrogenase subunit C [Devosia sp. YR412]
MDEVTQVDPLLDLGAHISGALGDAVLSQEVAYGELTLVVAREAIVDVVTFLRDDARCRFVSFVDVCGADYPARDERFDVVYHFMSPYLNQRIRVKVTADDVTPVPSITGVFKGAEWFEREAYDLYGMLFSGHGDLRRILTDYGFDGHPLRKDFPTTGFVEVRYDEERKRVVYEPVKLMQEYRSFDYLSPWEGTDYVLPGDEKAKP